MQQAVTNQDKKAEKSKRKVSGKLHNILLILVIIFLTASIVIGSILLFNIGGTKPLVLKTISKVPLVGKLVKPIEEKKTPQEIESERLQAERKDLNNQLIKLEEDKKELEEREKMISQKEDFLRDQEDEINSRLLKLNIDLNSIEEQVEYLEKMDSSKAVRIISNMGNKGAVVQILRNMNKDKSSAIIALMDPLQAAQVLEDIKQAEKEVYIYE